MLRSLKELYGYTVRAIDGEIGQVVDFYFDDQEWIVRYLVVDTGNWLDRHRVLLSVNALDQPKWAQQALPVLLTIKQVKQSPDIATDKPVSRQMEEELHDHYGWSPYWRPGIPAIGLGAAALAQVVIDSTSEEEATAGATIDPHLRSSREIIHYHVQASDGEVGKVEDFIADDESWRLCYLVIDTGGWLSGRQVLLAPAWTEEIDWAGRKIHLELDREMIKNSPKYDPSAPVNREYEMQLYDYYGRPQYRMKM